VITLAKNNTTSSTLKSAVIEYRKEIEEGNIVSFVLMKRAKACMVALPDLRWRELDNFLMHSDEDARFSRFVRIPDITPLIEHEQLELAGIFLSLSLSLSLALSLSVLSFSELC